MERKEVIFKQINDLKDISEKEGFATIFISAFLIVLIGFFMIKTLKIDPFFTSMTVLGLTIIGRPLVRKLYGDFAKKSDVIGNISFENDLLKWTKGNTIQVINSKEISSIILNYNYVQGRQYAYRDIIHNGLAHLTIQGKNNQNFEVKFLIETKEQLKKLKPIWENYYRQKIKITESMGKYGIKTILFEKDNLTYEKIQELKKRLEVDKFY